MKIIILGATGFIGRHLIKELLSAGHSVVAVGREPSKIKQLFGEAVIAAQWDGKTPKGWVEHLSAAAVLVNLSGENIGNIPWTEENRKLIIQSRLDSCNAVLAALCHAHPRPAKIIQASAIGYYGDANDFILEESSPSGKEFLSKVTVEWEKAIMPAEKLGCKVIFIRSATVLGTDGGALPKIATPFAFYLGGVIGSGKQWFSWIHIRDEVSAIRFLIENEESGGPYNLASPNPVQAKVFFNAVKMAVGKPALFWIPSFLVKLFMGKKGEELILSSKRVVPKRLLDAGFRFAHPAIDEAMNDLFAGGGK